MTQVVSPMLSPPPPSLPQMRGSHGLDLAEGDEDGDGDGDDGEDDGGPGGSSEDVRGSGLSSARLSTEELPALGEAPPPPS